MTPPIEYRPRSPVSSALRLGCAATLAVMTTGSDLDAQDLDARGLDLTVVAVPGRTDVRVTGAQPGQVIGVAMGRAPGHAVLPGGVTLAIDDPQLLGLATVDGNGIASLQSQFPVESARGESFLTQAWIWPTEPKDAGAAVRVSTVQSSRVPELGAAADVYVLFGQSNAEGHALSAGLPGALRGPLPRCRIWNELRQAFEPMQDGVNTRTLSPLDWCGPELTLGTGLAAGGAVVHLVKVAVADTTLGPSPGPFSEWSPAAHELYAVLQQRLAAACARLAADGLTPRFRGVCMMQGESDALSEALAHAYGERLGTLFAQLRNDLDALTPGSGGPVPIVFGRIHRALPSSFFPFVAAVRAAQDAVAHDLPGCAIVETSGLTLGPDGVHLDTAGVMALGNAFAAALQGLQGPQSGGLTGVVQPR